MAASHATPITSEAYLAAERKATQRHELVNRVVYAMSGASRVHGRIVGNLHFRLRSALRQWCELFVVDMRVSVQKTGLYTYADIVVVCGEGTYEDEHVDTLTNPLVLVEVLSPSTEAYDRGAKFVHYRNIPSLRAYVLVSQAYALAEVFLRNEEGEWIHQVAEGRSSFLHLPLLDVSLSLADLFEGLDVPDVISSPDRNEAD